MSRISKKAVHAALEVAAKNMLEAAGDDPFVSRADIRRKVAELEGVEAELTDIFYRFIDARDYRKGARVTKRDIDEGLVYAKEKIIDKYDLNGNGLSKSEIEEMSKTGQLAVALARELKSSAGLQSIEDVETWKAELDDLVKDLVYMGPGSESDEPLKAVHFPISTSRLDPAALITALQLDPTDPAQKLYTFKSRERLLTPSRTFGLGGLDGFAQAEKINEFAAKYLRSFSEAVIGEDLVIVQHPYYLLGVTAEGAIAGLQCQVVWT